MNKQDVIQFFDRCAPGWDADMIRHEDVLTAIFTGAGIGPDMEVLDVACGTGVLFPDYLRRGVASLTAIDISPEMAKIAQSKFPQVRVICGDVETTDFGKQFDAVMVYNAFPHFPDPAKLIRVLAGLVKPGGKLTVAHGMSREALVRHHSGTASKVSIDLISAQELAALFAPYFEVDVQISTSRMYQVSGVRRDGTAHSHSGHTHSHPHTHPHEHQPAEAEVLALLQYMVSHNDAHAQELAELASRLQESGKAKAYRQIMDAVAGFDVANSQLASVLAGLKTEAE